MQTTKGQWLMLNAVVSSSQVWMVEDRHKPSSFADEAKDRMQTFT
jgi:hypothetical protein